jgi:exonuclease III
LVDALRVVAPEVAVLTEFRRGGTGDMLEAGLAAIGFEHRAAPAVSARVNTVLVASRRPLRPLDFASPPELRRHAVAVETFGVALVAVYFPQLRDKIPVFEWLLKVSPTVTSRDAILVGDLNTGRNDIDREAGGVPFVAADMLDDLTTTGWTDAWRRQNPHAREYSWRSQKNGFRIDHAFVSPTLVPRVRSATYRHDVRESGVSDHSMLVVEFDLPDPAK